jgi:hypothetical protein
LPGQAGGAEDEDLVEDEGEAADARDAVEPDVDRSDVAKAAAAAAVVALLRAVGDAGADDEALSVDGQLRGLTARHCRSRLPKSEEPAAAAAAVASGRSSPPGEAGAAPAAGGGGGGGGGGGCGGCCARAMSSAAYT